MPEADMQKLAYVLIIEDHIFRFLLLAPGGALQYVCNRLDFIENPKTQASEFFITFGLLHERYMLLLNSSAKMCLCPELFLIAIYSLNVF